MTATTSVETHAMQLATLINKKQYNKASNLSSTVATILLTDEKQLEFWLSKVKSHLNPVNGFKLTFWESNNPITRQLLKVKSGMRFFCTTPESAPVRPGENFEEEEKRAWNNTHHFTLTDKGLRYIGRVTYEQLVKAR